MSDFEYIIIGGGVSGIGALEEALEQGIESIALLEARDNIMYSTTWMKYVAIYNPEISENVTGNEFRISLLPRVQELEKSGKILMSNRAFYIDQKNRKIYARNAHGEKRVFTYKTLIISVGAAQIVYGKYLLPGIRGGRFFTTYQVGEMLATLRFFLPGKNLVIFGESLYSLETALAAKKAGILVTIVSTGDTPITNDNWPDSIKVYYNCTLKQLYGDAAFSGMLIQKGSGELAVNGDAFAVDGDFVLEHPWREQLGVEWNLSEWHLNLSLKEMSNRSLIFVGDSFMPSPNFIHQYNAARETIRRHYRELRNKK